jgi:hypothetical protein
MKSLSWCRFSNEYSERLNMAVTYVAGQQLKRHAIAKPDLRQASRTKL